MTSKKENLPPFWKTYETSFEKGLPKSVYETQFVVLDTETTGFSLKKDRMLSIGALRLHQGSIKAKDAFEVFLNQDTFDAKTVEIHGILKKGKRARRATTASFLISTVPACLPFFRDRKIKS